MLMGRATWNSERGVSSFSHEKLRFYWRIPNVATELRVRRVKWFQTMVDSPMHHKQVPAAIWGKLRGEAGQLDTDG
eukprot:12725394-Heterocapsa_arctica.AAC.1